MSSAADVEGIPRWLEIDARGVTLNVLARPGASRRGVLREHSDGLVIGLQSHPQRGQANAELIRYLAEILEIPRSSIEVTRGAATRRKRVRITTANRPKMAQKCAVLLKPQ